MLLQPPKLLKEVNTVLASVFGARAPSVAIIPMKPVTWRRRIRISNNGRCLAPTVLKRTARAQTAIVMSVPCLM
jgi:hypothetical protein